jgi:NADP-dependent 3-hydroxy acid dehydrogenase YdfG
MDLSGKNAVVTGASSGIGISFSKKLIEKGARVYGLARRLNKLTEVQEELGDSFIPVKMDITKPNDIQQWVKDTFSEDNLPHILINNAGLGIFGNVENLSIDDWNTMV